MKTNTRQLTSPSSDFDVRLRNYTEDEAFGSIHDELSQNQASQLFSVVSWRGVGAPGSAARLPSGPAAAPEQPWHTRIPWPPPADRAA